MDTPTTTSTGTTAIEARGLGCDFGQTRALGNLDLRVPEGEICTLLGRNGAGKTTFIRCALGLLRPSRGSLRILGEAPGSAAAKQSIGAMLQSTDLSAALTPREQLELFASYYERPASIDAIIADTGIGAFAGKQYRRLSGGQKRRAQFALALVGRPRLLFLDEPTTGLDTDARRAVWDCVRKLAAQGCTVILTTHYLEEADALADRIVILHEGRVIADDTAARIRRYSEGAVIRCRTRLDAEQAGALPGVRGVDLQGRLLSLRCDHAPTTLRALLAADPDLDELEVGKAKLEQLFTALTDAAAEEA